MNTVIKDRIAKINNGQVPEGYEKTSFGIFPRDWKKVSLGEVCSKKGEYGLNAPACEYEEGLPKYIRITDIDEQGRYVDNNAYVNDVDSNKYILQNGDIVFARTGASVGKNYIYDKKDGILVYAGFLIKFSIKPEYNPYIVCANCRTKKYENWVSKISARSGQPGINAEEYATYSFILPKTEQEQSRIAQILMQWDKTIELQEKYIASLENRKKALMQRLLIPQNDWEEVRIGDVFKITRGVVLPVSECNEDFKYPVYSSQTMNNGLMGYYDKYLFEDSITWTTDGANAGEVNFRKGKFFCTNVCGVLLSNNGYSNQCFAYLLNSITKQYVSFVGNPKLMNNVMANIRLKIPSLDFQNKVSILIQISEEEISLQKQKLQKLIAQRKALMQVLLTGIVRV